MRSHPRTLATLTLVAFLAITGCDSDDPGGGDGNGPLEPGEVVYSVEYHPSVTVLADEGLAALVEADTARRRYVFSAAALAASGADVSQGRILLLPGYDLGRITASSETGSQRVVELERVPLTEAIENGRIAWNQSFSFTEETVGQMTVDGHAGRRGAGNTFVWEYAQGDFTFHIEITPEGDHADILARVVKGEMPNPTAAFTGTGRLDGINSVVDAVYRDGELREFRFENADLSGEMDLSMAAAAAGVADMNFTMPEFAVRWPIPPSVIPIPTFVGVGVQFVASFSVLAGASATLSTGLSYSGDAGFALGDVEIEPRVEFGEPSFDPTEADAAATIGIAVDAQVGIAFPRVTLNVLNQEVAYVLTGFTAGSSLTWGPICKRAYTRLLVQGGYALSLMGLTLAEGDMILVDRQRTGAQEGCDGGGGARPLPLVFKPHPVL